VRANVDALEYVPKAMRKQVKKEAGL
jgi:hypothetical protein